MAPDTGSSVTMGSRVPIRWRLTLWYVALLAAALAVFSGAFYFGLRQLLYDSLDSSLRNHAALALNAVEVRSDGEPLLDTDATRLSEDYFIRLSDQSGRVVAAVGDDVDELPANPAGWTAAQDGRSDLRWISSSDDPLRVLSQPVVADGAVVGAIEIGVASDLDDTLGLALLLIAGSGPVVLLVAGLGGAWLARRSLKPVDRITNLAAEIGGDLSRRIDLSLPDDELGRLARTFNLMLDRIEDAFLRQRRFVADAAHELRTPLALLQGQIELALARPRDPRDDQASLELLRDDLERLNRLANALLALAQRDAQGIPLALEPFDLPALLELVAEQYASAASEAGVSVRVDARPARVVADEDRLLQVIVNLVDNAVRHAPAGSEVVLGCRREGDVARFWVADGGEGIDPEHLPRVFDPFYRVGPDAGRGGIGLGLSIARAVVEAHDGTIQIASAPGAGTIVTVRVPLRGDS